MKALAKTEVVMVDRVCDGYGKTLVLPQSGSEPWFECELLRTGPMFSLKFGLQLELNTRSSPRFPQVRILLNLFEQVRTPPNQ